MPMTPNAMGARISVATYNVHRWGGFSGRRRLDPTRAGAVIAEMEADVMALQEVLRPSGDSDPLGELAESLGLYMAFAATRAHKRGELGNAILSRWPIAGISILDLTCSRLERRAALAASFEAPGDGCTREFSVVATHLALVDRTRRRQVRSLLDHPHLHVGPTVLLGDLNAWRRCKATRTLDRELEAHHNRAWPPSFPSARPVLALDRVYVRGAKVLEISSHDSPAARRASDHLPVVAHIELPEPI